MPKYSVFVIFANRPALDESDDGEKPHGDPLYERILRDFFNWMQGEIKAERLQGADFLDESSEETSIKVDFQTPDEVKEGKLDDKLKESSIDDAADDGAPPLVASKSSVRRGSQHALSRDILGYFTIEFPTVDDVIAWAQSCPLSFEGCSLEIRRLHDTKKAIEDIPPDIRERTGDQMLATRERNLQEGKLKKNDDGTLWAKVELEGPAKDMLDEAEERKAQKEQE
ncbi:hypothetical protein PFICI_14795 [Pestalotiopsis fici W106-1]|uniref:Uncharacterized protein n=1 Tax=Pestalotiopsis fici (strain W106-1 / CGMCC3.15140) TaxID=1229662 RepID=W3WJA9_PESFW|nr:uncharacterized protein PFICI_14795 [Pestalotiopsis fici W106-1]ETS73849.1 hypothetical protein PFICI_14795 [Pestalotiopsis fici W106-1]